MAYTAYTDINLQVNFNEGSNMTGTLLPPNYNSNAQENITPMGDDNNYNQNNHTSTGVKENLLQINDGITDNPDTPGITITPVDDKIKNEETEIYTIRKILDIILIQIIIITSIVSLNYFLFNIKLNIKNKDLVVGGVSALYYAILSILFCIKIEKKRKDSKCILYTFIILFTIGVSAPLFIYSQFTFFALILILTGVFGATICAHLKKEIKFLYYFFSLFPLPIISALIMYFVFKINYTLLIISSILSLIYFIYFVFSAKVNIKEISPSQYIYGVVCHNIWLLIIILILALIIVGLLLSGGGGGGGGGSGGGGSSNNKNKKKSYN